MSREKREARERAEREWAAREASTGFYTATLPAPPHPHHVLGVVAGGWCLSAMEAVVSMQNDARELGADGVLGVTITPSGSDLRFFFAYGTAVKWAQSE